VRLSGATFSPATKFFCGNLRIGLKKSYVCSTGRGTFFAPKSISNKCPTVVAPITSNTATVGKSGVLFQTYGRDSVVLLGRVTMIEKGRFGTDTIPRGSPLKLNGWDFSFKWIYFRELLRFVYFAG
jgi:hypothetical protein